MGIAKLWRIYQQDFPSSIEKKIAHSSRQMFTVRCGTYSRTCHSRSRWPLPIINWRNPMLSIVMTIWFTRHDARLSDASDVWKPRPTIGIFGGMPIACLFKVHEIECVCLDVTRIRVHVNHSHDYMTMWQHTYYLWAKSTQFVSEETT